jgi:hypothetical protein
MRNVSYKIVGKIKKHTLYVQELFSFQKSCLFGDSVEKFCRARQATGVNITRRMRFTCLTNKATNTI